ncbi:hypothetical protein PPL_00274 [Heterostelium album PN500]|uniref:Endonuclease/exonuclease/phosphatase domain-containing protein n=1 Tax=Heterostelium pallidum (strain ATCC 26659 / Pp 5 / PN500) TaxID=670386 RepID=D3AW07_HETP5|nr:hypothetical protein PPL_00274 [Heterostelium album PN500]EFA86480.1 hypothetical protein PPL_00274 [Heterostelium album PN500]|eukprot:XP_020438585.1 hypothetical protein PPL_00274 [Heterostelium album PN500]
MYKKEINIKILSINPKCASNKCKYYKSPMTVTKERIKISVTLSQPDFITIQEPIWTSESLKHWFNVEDYHVLRNKNLDTAILYHQRYTLVRDFTPDGGRFTMGLFTYNGFSFMVSSFHGRNNGMTIPKKKAHFKELIGLVQLFNRDLGVPIIVGGDFNIEIRSLLKFPYIAYELLPKIDNIIVYSPPSGDYHTRLGDYDYIKEVESYGFHTPLKATMTFNYKKDCFKNISFKFNLISLIEVSRRFSSLFSEPAIIGLRRPATTEPVEQRPNVEVQTISSLRNILKRGSTVRLESGKYKGSLAIFEIWYGSSARFQIPASILSINTTKG